MIATAEKALCDKIREDRGTGVRSMKDMRNYLIKELRISEERLADLDLMKIAKIADGYRSAKIRLLHKITERVKIQIGRDVKNE